MTTSKQTPAVSKSRVMLVEDHPVVRHGLANLIDDEPDLAVCCGAESMSQALEMVGQHKPDIVVVDIALGDGSGLELIKQLHDLHPDLPLLALSMHDEAVYGERAIRAGAKGYIMKKEAMDKVMTAIRRVLDGEIYVSDKMASRMVRKFIHPEKAAEQSQLGTLSDREFQVFTHIAQGVGPTEIAQKLGVSIKTVETHREHIKQKLALKSAAELTRYALQWTLDQR